MDFDELLLQILGCELSKKTPSEAGSLGRN
jgi:hypothetical protein